jgi:hypothetical protein
MNPFMTYPNAPDLGIWIPFKQSIRSGHRILGKFKAPCLDIDRHNPAMITVFDLLANLSFIDLVATSSKFFFAVAELINCHGLDLISTLSLHFNSHDRRLNRDRGFGQGCEEKEYWGFFRQPNLRAIDLTI